MASDSTAGVPEWPLAPAEAPGTPLAGVPASGVPDGPADLAGPSSVDRNLQVRSSNRVYQAAGDQYIYDRPPPAPAAVTNTLPRDTATFTGRSAELRRLVEAVTETAALTRVIAIHAISGMPGVGKTALAVHAGHLMEHRFPDGQLFINLHGHTAGQGPVRPADALHKLLSADGMPASEIPAGLDERAARWRSRMAGKKVLVILDNAAERSQVEPLLPGAAGCLVLITSRRRLTGLGAQQATVTLALDTLPPDQAVALFLRRANRLASAAEAPAVRRLVQLCGYLPLAIALIAARLRPEPGWKVADLVQELAHPQDRLALMRAEDVAVATAFDLSYRNLPASLRRFFRRLGLHPGADLDAYAAAALNDVPLAKARRYLDALYDDHLLDQPDHGRYRMHDLISDYTRYQAGGEPAADSEQAVGRLLDYYCGAARAADRHLVRHGRPAAARPVVPGGLPVLDNRVQALAWMRTEQANLAACASYAIRHGHHAQLVDLAAAMATFMRHAGPWSHAVALHEAAVAAAGRIGDLRGQADALGELGVVRQLTGDYPAAGQALHLALERYQQLGVRSGEAHALHQLGRVQWPTGDYQEATRTLQRALAIFQDLGEQLGQADVLSDLGVVRYFLDDYQGAIKELEQALAVHRELGDRPGQADALNELGVVRRLTGDYSGASRVLKQALSLFADLGDRRGQADTLNQLGGVRWRIGDHPGATEALQQSLAINRDLDDRHGQANALNDLGIVRYQTGDLPGATQALEQAMALYGRLDYRLGQADTLNQMGVVRRLSGDLAGAGRAHEQALAIFTELGDRLGQAETLNNIGVLMLARDRPEQGRAQHQLALRLAREVRSPLEEAHAIAGTGRCAQRQGDMPGATSHLRRALAIYQQIGAPEALRLAGFAADAGEEA